MHQHFSRHHKLQTNICKGYDTTCTFQHHFPSTNLITHLMIGKHFTCTFVFHDDFPSSEGFLHNRFLK